LDVWATHELGGTLFRAVPQQHHILHGKGFGAGEILLGGLVLTQLVDALERALAELFRFQHRGSHRS
jgi:hypothetical protein